MFAGSCKIEAFLVLADWSRDTNYFFPSRNRWKAVPKKVIALYAKGVIALQFLS